MKIVYKCKENGILRDVNLATFNGYKISIDNNKISKITEYSNAQEISNIVFRPTKIPIIHKIEYSGHVEYRYNNNAVSTQYFQHNDTLYGEYKKFSPSGELLARTYYYEGVDVTLDIMKYIGYTDDFSTFINYDFKEYEIFNLMLKYGYYFRFSTDLRYSSEFDKITEYCKKDLL